jgi:hypothetical protein
MRANVLPFDNAWLDRTDQRRRTVSWQLTLTGLLAATYVSVLASGYKLNDLLVYLPLTLYLRDPSLYPGSALVQHLLGMPYPVYRLYSLFYDQRLLYFVFLVTRFALVVALYAFGWQLTRTRAATWLGLLAVLLLPSQFGSLGSTLVLTWEASQYAFAAPLGVFALAAALARRQIWAFILAGAAFDLQPLLGSAALALLSANVVINETLLEKRVSLRHCGLWIGLGVLAALPGVLMPLSGQGTTLLATDANYLAIVRLGAYFHVFPSTFSAIEYVSSVIAMGFCVSALRLRIIGEHTRIVVIWLLVILGFCIVGAVFSELIPVGVVLKLMPFRSTFYLKILACFLAASCLIHSAAHGTLGQRAYHAGLLLASIFTLTFLQDTSAPDWIPAKLVTVVLVVVVAASVGAGLAGWRTGSAESTYSFVSDAIWSRRLPSSAIVLLFVVGVTVPMVAGLPRGRVQFLSDAPADDLEAAAFWAKDNTARDALFATPPDEAMAKFTIVSQRNTLGDAKLAGQSLFDAHFASILFRRLMDLGCGGPWCEPDTYWYFTAEDFRAIQQRYGACYALTRANAELNLAEQYRNQSYRIYRVCE